MTRRDDAKTIRVDAAEEEYVDSQTVTHTTNGEEDDYGKKRIANYSKGFPHDDLGFVDQSAYDKFLEAVMNEDSNKFGDIPTGIELQDQNKKYFKLTNPISGLAFDLEGQDCHGLSVNPPPRIDSDLGAAEIAELYWMAICRDVPFKKFEDNHLIKEAVSSLNKDFSAIGNWSKDNSGNTNANTIFRGNFEGDLKGPFVSQFLLKGHQDDVLKRDEKAGFVKYGAASYDNRIVVGLEGKDFLTHYDAWLAVQNGEDRNLSLLQGNSMHSLQNFYDNTPRFIHNMRGLASYVHFDKLYQAYLNALIYLTRLADFNNEILDDGNPYKEKKPPKDFKGTPETLNPLYKNQQGFGTFGAPHILSLVTEVASRALKVAWFQKWFVYRRLRPEAFGGLIHLCKIGKIKKDDCLHINEKILNSDVLDRIAKLNKDQNERFNRPKDKDPAPDGKYYLLPQAFPEGSPTHPSFPAGHATVAGACVTVLKAWFNEDYEIENPVQANREGTQLERYEGTTSLTIGGELNKLAANIAVGRNMAGVHYRADYLESVKLGEKLAISILKDQRKTYLEKYHLTLKGKYQFDDNHQDITIPM